MKLNDSLWLLANTWRQRTRAMAEEAESGVLRVVRALTADRMLSHDEIRFRDPVPIKLARYSGEGGNTHDTKYIRNRNARQAAIHPSTIGDVL